MPKSDMILDSALDLFETRGYDATPVPLVAEHAGVAAGTIYRYFPGKEGMVNALYRRWKSALSAALLDDLDIEGPADVVFDTIWQRLCSFVLANPSAFAFLETHHHRAYLDAESRRIGDELDQAISELVVRWQRNGTVRAGRADLLVAQVYGGLVGVVRTCRDHGGDLPADLAERTVTGAWNLLARTPTQEMENRRWENNA
jgi:AcrR family transcriptional regulator